jgi:GNAT superfamily N-acetyltransferase
VAAERVDDALRALAGTRTLVGGYEIDDDPARVDRDVVCDYLSTQAYWGRSRTRADVETQLDRAWRFVGAYRDGAMGGFARAVSDGVSFGYLADVFVLPAARGAGLGKALVEAMLAATTGCAGRCSPPTRTVSTPATASPRPTARRWSARYPPGCETRRRGVRRGGVGT